jgi:hypothetical protein
MAGPETDPVKQNPETTKATTAPANKYVGTPAIGTSKAAAAAGIAAVGPDNSAVDQRRRRLAWIGIGAFLGAWFLAFFRFAGSSVRDLRTLHASGMHAGLEAQRKQVQVSVPREWIRQRRHQLRRPGAAPDGPRSR